MINSLNYYKIQMKSNQKIFKEILFNIMKIKKQKEIFKFLNYLILQLTKFN